MVTVSDKKIGHGAGNGTIDYYEVDVVSAQDLYPFGMMMKERALNSSGRYGFNGQEMSNEISVVGNNISFIHRIHDPRLSRFLSVDPLTKEYPWYSPYQFAEIHQYKQKT